MNGATADPERKEKKKEVCWRSEIPVLYNTHPPPFLEVECSTVEVEFSRMANLVENSSHVTM